MLLFRCHALVYSLVCSGKVASMTERNVRTGQKCLAELFFGQPFCLDFQIPRKLPKPLAAHRVLLRGPFAIRDLVLMKRPQMPKGQNPYTGPFWVIEVVGRYMNQLSDGQKWNCCRLKRYLPSPVEWTELVLQSLSPPQGGVGIAITEEAGAGADDAVEDVARVADAVDNVARVMDVLEDVAGIAVAQDDVAMGAKDVLPGPIMNAPLQDDGMEPRTVCNTTDASPTVYQWTRCSLRREGGRNDVFV